MLHKRHFRVIGRATLLVLFLLAGAAVLRFFLETVDNLGWTPGAFFGLLLVVTIVALVWRTALDLRSAVKRM